MDSYYSFNVNVNSNTIEKIINEFNEREDREFSLGDLSDFFREEDGDDSLFKKSIDYKKKPLDLLISYIDGEAEWLKECPILMDSAYEAEDAIYFLENLSSLIKENKEAIEKDLCLYISSTAQEEGGASDHFGIEEYQVNKEHGTYFFLEGECDICEENVTDWNDLNSSEWDCLNEWISYANIGSPKPNQNMINLIKKYGIYEKI